MFAHSSMINQTESIEFKSLKLIERPTTAKAGLDMIVNLNGPTALWHWRSESELNDHEDIIEKLLGHMRSVAWRVIFDDYYMYKYNRTEV